MSLKDIQEMLRQEVEEDFAQATNHPYMCRCAQCWRWWKIMRADPDTGKWGPFTEEEIQADKPPQVL